MQPKPTLYVLHGAHFYRGLVKARRRNDIYLPTGHRLSGAAIKWAERGRTTAAAAVQSSEGYAQETCV